MLAIVTCFFNVSNFARPQANLHRFLRLMQAQEVPVFGVEARLAHLVTATEPSSWTKWSHLLIQPKTQLVWQKEACLNLAEKIVPPEYDKIAWVDADLWFQNPTWVRDTEQALEEFDVVQMFDTAHWTSKYGKIELSRPSVASKPLDARWTSHPGFAWAMRRSLWQKSGGLYPFAVSGGCDTIMSLAFAGIKPWDVIRGHMGADPSFFNEWASHFHGVRLGCVPGQVYHEWHGTRADRQYRERMEAMSKVNHRAHLHIGPNGLLTWTGDAPQAAVSAAAKYFNTRREDG